MKTLPRVVTTPPRWQLLQWIADPLRFLYTCTARYGDSFTADLGRRIQIHFSSHPQPNSRCWLDFQILKIVLRYTSR